MSYQIKQSTTAYPLLFLMVDSTDHLTGKTGLSPTVTIRKVGGSFASPSGAVTEIAHGWYQVAGNATDSNTLGPLLLHATGTAADVVDREYEVVAYDPQDAVRLGLTALPNAAAEASGGLYTRGTGAGQINQDANGRIDTNTKTWIGGTIPAVNVTGVPLIDAKYLLGTVLATPATAGILDVNAKNINNVATTSVTTVGANVGTTQPINFTGTAGSALAKTDMVDIAGVAVSTSTAQLGVNVVSAATDAISAASVSAAAVTKIQTGLSTLAAADIRTAMGLGSANLDTQLAAIAGYIDTEIGTIAGYLDTEIAAIKAKTDLLPSTFPTVDGSGRVTVGAIVDGIIDSDTFTVAAVSGVETGILEQIRQLWRRHYAKTTFNATTGAVKTYADNGSTVFTTQTGSDDGTTQTLGAAS